DHDPILFFLQAEDGIRYLTVTGVQTCALPICRAAGTSSNGTPAVNFKIANDGTATAMQVGFSRTGSNVTFTWPGNTLTLPAASQIGRASCRESAKIQAQSGCDDSGVMELCIVQ